MGCLVSWFWVLARLLLAAVQALARLPENRWGVRFFGARLRPARLRFAPLCSSAPLRSGRLLRSASPQAGKLSAEARKDTREGHEAGARAPVRSPSPAPRRRRIETLTKISPPSSSQIPLSEPRRPPQISGSSTAMISSSKLKSVDFYRCARSRSVLPRSRAHLSAHLSCPSSPPRRARTGVGPQCGALERQQGCAARCGNGGGQR